MKHSTIARVFSITALAALALGIAPPAHAGNRACSLATLRGSFADKDSGVITSPPAIAGPFAGLFLETFDGKGGLTGSGIGSLNGTIVRVTEKGTYTVNADCTGTYTVQVSPLGLTTHASFVIDDDRNELQIIVTDPGTVITCIARRQFPSGDLD